MIAAAYIRHTFPCREKRREREGEREGERGYKHPPLSFDFVGCLYFWQREGNQEKKRKTKKSVLCA